MNGQTEKNEELYFDWLTDGISKTEFATEIGLSVWLVVWASSTGPFSFFSLSFCFASKTLLFISSEWLTEVRLYSWRICNTKNRNKSNFTLFYVLFLMFSFLLFVLAIHLRRWELYLSLILHFFSSSVCMFSMSLSKYCSSLFWFLIIVLGLCWQCLHTKHRQNRTWKCK